MEVVGLLERQPSASFDRLTVTPLGGGDLGAAAYEGSPLTTPEGHGNHPGDKRPESVCGLSSGCGTSEGAGSSITGPTGSGDEGSTTGSDGSSGAVGAIGPDGSGYCGTSSVIGMCECVPRSADR